MPLYNDKRDIFNQVSVLNSLKNENITPLNIFNSYSSISNDKDSVLFLVDLLISLAGTDSLENTFSGLFTTYINTYEDKIKDLFVKEFIDYDSTNDLPSNFIVNGLNFPIIDIDSFGVFKTNMNDAYSSLVYDDLPESFNNKIFESINAPFVDIIYNNNLKINFNNESGLINIKPIGSTTIRDFIYKFIFGFTKINQKKLISEIFDIIFGTISKYNKKTKNQIKNKLEIDLIIKKIINDEDLEFTDNEIISLNNSVETTYNKVNEIDVGCGFIQNILTIEDLYEFSDIITNNNITEFENKLNDFINNSINNNTDVEYKNNVKNNLIKQLISLFKEYLIKELFLSPEKKILFLIVNSLKNIDFKNDFDFINNNLNTIKCLKTEIDSDINEYLFNLVKKLIIDLTKPIALEIIKENIKNYTNIIKSLVI